MEKKKKRPLGRDFSRPTVIALIVIVLASLAHPVLLWLTRPHFIGEIIYPLVIRRSIFFLLTILIISIAAIFMFKFVGKRAWVIPIFVLLFNSLVVFAAIAPDDAFGLFLRETNHVRWQEREYYVGIFSEMPYDWYVTYECDSSGIFCYAVEATTRTYEGILPTKFTLSEDESELYVVIGEEEFVVATQSPCDGGICN